MPKIGDYDCHVVHTGEFRLDGGAMFGIIPKALWSRHTDADDRNRIQLAMRCLLLASQDRVILIDNGVGHKYDEKFSDIFAIDHSTYTLESSLDELGLSTEDVTDVVLTHLHFDHCGGSTVREGKSLELAFPRATYHVQDAHWRWAGVSNPREEASFLSENIEPLARSNQLRRVDGPGVILPGIRARVVNGHTRGQQVIEVFDSKRTLVFVADLIPTVAHMKPVWGMAYDVEPLATIREKERFLEEALANGWHLFFEHDPEVEVVDLEQSNGVVRATDPRPLSVL